jgi:hypothetical protein
VIAADYWGGPIRRMPVPPALPGSHEDVLHNVLGTPSLLIFPEDRTSGWLRARLGHRAIGVVYDPIVECAGNWVPTTMGDCHDAFCFFEETEALHPLHGERPSSARRWRHFPRSLARSRSQASISGCCGACSSKPMPGSATAQRNWLRRPAGRGHQ